MVDNTKPELLHVSEIALDYVITFYEKKGLALDYRPQFKLIPDNYPRRDNVLMGVSIEGIIHDAFITQLSRSFEKEMWRDMAGIEISDRAVEEITQWYKNISATTSLPPLDNKTIYLFPQSSTLLSQHRRFSAIIAHEYWHLIEQEQGIIKDTPLICEGTARYVEERYTNQLPSTSIESAKGFLSLLYSGAAMIVANRLSKSPSNYTPLLNPEVRQSIQKEFIERTKPVIAEKFSTDLKSPSFKKITYEAYLQIPEYRELQGNISAKSLLDTFTKQGKITLVEEIKDKDLTRLVQYWKDLGFE